MNSYRPDRASNSWIFVLKIIVLIIGIYITILVLSKIFTWVLAVVFAIVKVLLFLLTAIVVLHFFLKVLFGFDLLRYILGNRFRRH